MREEGSGITFEDHVAKDEKKYYLHLRIRSQYRQTCTRRYCRAPRRRRRCQNVSEHGEPLGVTIGGRQHLFRYRTRGLQRMVERPRPCATHSNGVLRRERVALLLSVVDHASTDAGPRSHSATPWAHGMPVVGTPRSGDLSRHDGVFRLKKRNQNSDF